MYFKNIEKFPISQIIIDDEKIHAHVFNGRKETLKEHIELSTQYLDKIIDSKNLDLMLLNFESKFAQELSDESRKLYRDMIFNTIYMHDIGKINCNFQYKRMGNEKFKGKDESNSNNSNHSMLSSLIYLNHYFVKLQNHKDKKDLNKLLVFLVLNAYVISKHHGSLDSFGDFRYKLLEEGEEGKRLYTEQRSLFNKIYKKPIIFVKNEDLLKMIFENVDISLNKMAEDKNDSPIYLYIYERILTSLLLSCDYYATSEFKNQRRIENFGSIYEINKFYSVFKNTEINKGIHQYQEQYYGKIKDFNNIKSINILRNELFLEAEENLLKNINEDIFYLEAPTGSGKSNIGFNLSFKLLEQLPSLNKVFYVYPFNTLIEQNMDTLRKVFQNSTVMDNVSIINSVIPIKERALIHEDSDVIKTDYETSLLDRQFLHYPMILTTHVSIFNYLFGTSKDNLFPLYQMANSVIILDEIQSYKNDIWKEIITFLKYYAETLNIKFIIMSATLPNLNQLIDKKTDTINLIQNRDRYFKNPIFKERVKLDFTLLEVDESIMEVLLKHVIENAKKADKNILIEFIKKQSAMDFYKHLKKHYSLKNGEQSKEIELLTGDDNSIERHRVIQKIKSNKNIILVATQVIEAGVDIDMDLGYKDISKLDSEEQFLGRINRSCMKDYCCTVYFFNLDDAAYIYKNDIRKDKSINLIKEEIQEILISKNFGLYYDYVLKRLNDKAKKLNDDNFEKFIYDNVKGLNFKKVEKKMTLIDEHYEYSVFLSRQITLENGEVVDGDKVWEEYICLLNNNNLDYAEKRVRLSQKRAKLSHFIYKVSKNDFSYNKRLGDLYYIEDGEKYFMDGKFDRENFNMGIGDFI